jgi:hypothetical protein
MRNARPFYGELVDFMSRGPIVSAILEKDNAVEDFRTLIMLLIQLMQLKVLYVKHTLLYWRKCSSWF